MRGWEGIGQKGREERGGDDRRGGEGTEKITLARKASLLRGHSSSVGPAK